MKKVIFLVLMACTPVPVHKTDCYTRCGIHLESPLPGNVDPNVFTCEGLQAWEDRTIDNVTHRLKPEYDETRWPFVFPKPATEEGVCGALAGLNLQMMDTASWSIGQGYSVAGVTRCSRATSQIGLQKNWYTGSLTHESMHWLQRCYWDERAQGEYVDEITASLAACSQAAKTEIAAALCLSFYQDAITELGQVGYHAHWKDWGIQAVIDDNEAFGDLP